MKLFNQSRIGTILRLNLSKQATNLRTLKPALFLCRTAEYPTRLINKQILMSLTLSVALMTGCAQQASIPQSPSKAETAPATIPARAFEPDTLYALLTAELAGNRQQFDVALANYTQQAEETRDPQVAKRAYKIASYIGVKSATAESAILWAEIAPHNESARNAAIFSLIQADQLIEALAFTQKIQAPNKGALLQNIAASANNLTHEERAGLLSHYQKLTTQFPDNNAYRVGYALLLQQQGQLPAALALAKTALEIDASNTTAAILVSGILHKLKRPDEALKGIERSLKKSPNNTRLRLQYARLLTFIDIDKAQPEFQRLVDLTPQDPDLRLALALIAKERGDNLTAKKSFQILLKFQLHEQASYIHLGEIALKEKDTENALKHFLHVSSGPELLTAISHTFDIYIASNDFISAEDHAEYRREQHPELAKKMDILYSRSLLKVGKLDRSAAALSAHVALFPSDIDALYARAMVYDQLGHTPQTEQDLRTIIDLEPDNATALNTLGYVLIERTERYQEAYKYIDQALTIKPKDPAIIDSMGWVHYRLGNFETALTYLQEAMQIYPDHEIAAHLGEALWVTGQQSEALLVWRTGLDLNPNSSYILNTLERLQVQLK